MEAFYAELKKRAETASSSYSVQYIYSVHVTKNDQNNRPMVQHNVCNTYLNTQIFVSIN